MFFKRLLDERLGLSAGATGTIMAVMYVVLIVLGWIFAIGLLAYLWRRPIVRQKKLHGEYVDALSTFKRDPSDRHLKQIAIDRGRFAQRSEMAIRNDLDASA